MIDKICIQTNMFDSIKQYLDSEKIVHIIGKTQKENICGMILFKKGGYYNCDLWLQCNDTCHADKNYIDDSNRAFYEKAVDFIIEAFDEYYILNAALGCEMYIYDSENISEKIKKSSALVWIIDSKIKLDLPIGFTLKNIGEYNILTKTESKL